MRIDLPELRVGTMLIKDGTTTKIPHLPDMKVRGNAWVLESTPTKLRIYEKDTAWGFIPMIFDQTLQLNPDNTINFTLQSTAFGLPLPTLHKQYELTNARRGYLELKTLDAKNPSTGYISAQDGWFEIDLPGPLGSHDKKRIPIIQPSDSRYKPCPLATAAK